MKRTLLVALLLSFAPVTTILLVTSCATTQVGKLAQVKALSYAAASIGTREALLQNATWRPRFETAYERLDALVTAKAVTGEALREVLAALPVKELKSPQAVVAIEGATLLYDVLVGTKVSLQAQPYTLSAAEGIRDGLKIALGR